MSFDIAVSLTCSDEKRKLIDDLCSKYDQTVGEPTTQTFVTPDSLTRLGAALWAATDLDWKQVVETIDAAKDDNAAVRLVINDPESDWPWDLLYHENVQIGFVATNANCCVVRHFAGNLSSPTTKSAGPLRVLLFVSSPEDLHPQKERLDYEKEAELLFAATDRSLANGDIEIDVAEDGAVDTLFARLDERHYHAVILSMHGTQIPTDDANTPRYGLLFEDPNTWRKQPVDVQELNERLDAVRKKPDLFLLSACKSGHAFESEGALTSVAPVIA